MNRRFMFGFCLMMCVMLMLSGCRMGRELRFYQEQVTQTASELQNQSTSAAQTEQTEKPSDTSTKQDPIASSTGTTSAETTTHSNPDDAWRTAYMQYLRNYMDERDLFNRGGSGAFSLVFIDDDDIPELVVSDDLAHYATANVLSYGRNGIVDHGTFGTFGQIQYLEKKNIIVSHVEYQGDSMLSIHKLTPVGAKELWKGSHRNVWDESSMGFVEMFHSYDELVSAEKYYSLYHQFVPDESALKYSLDDSNPYAFSLTQENIEKIGQIKLR